MTNSNEQISNEAAAERRATIQTIRTTPSLTAMTDEQLNRLSFEAKVLGDLRTGNQTRKAKLKAATVTLDRTSQAHLAEDRTSPSAVAEWIIASARDRTVAAG